MKQLLLIDANSIIHRCYHALPPLTAPDGRPSQSVYGIGSILLRLWRDGRPDYAAALFDRPEPTFRKEKFEEYKAQRPSAPSELVSQIIEAHNIFPAFGIRTFEAPGWEADDLIATLARKFKAEPDLQVVILTGDLDTLQLVEGDKVVVRTFRKGISDTLTYDQAAVIARYGLAPEQIADYKAMIGDASDNLKGIPGIGPKTALAILTQYGTLEAALGASDSDPRLKVKLGGQREIAQLSRDLVTLRDYKDIPVGSLEDLRIEPDNAKVETYFESMGFETLIKRLKGGESQPRPPKKEQAPPSAQGGLF